MVQNPCNSFDCGGTGSLYQVAAIRGLRGVFFSNKLSITCPWVLDWEQRRSWDCLIELDYGDLVANGILEPSGFCGFGRTIWKNCLSV